MASPLARAPQDGSISNLKFPIFNFQSSSPMPLEEETANRGRRGRARLSPHPGSALIPRLPAHPSPKLPPLRPLLPPLKAARQNHDENSSTVRHVRDRRA